MVSIGNRNGSSLHRAYDPGLGTAAPLMITVQWCVPKGAGSLQPNVTEMPRFSYPSHPVTAPVYSTKTTMETATDDVIRITEAALAKLVETAERETIDLASTYLRIAVVPGGCSGLTYDLGWDTEASAQDKQLRQDVFRIVVDPRSAAYLSGSTLDFSDGLEGKGFHFHNPQAVRSCACGESFGL